MLSTRLFTCSLVGAIALLAACGKPNASAASSDSTVAEGTTAKVSVDHICNWSYGTIDSAYAPPAVDLALSPDGKTIAFTSCADTKQLQRGMLLDPASGALTPIDDASSIQRVRFSPDGKYVYYAAFARAADASTLELRVRSIDGSFEKKIPFFSSTIASPLLDQRVEGSEITFSPDGKTAVAYGYDVDSDDRIGHIVVAPLDKDGIVTLAPSGPLSDNADVRWAPDGSRVLFLSTTPARAQGFGFARPQRAIEVSFTAPDKPVASSPPWIAAGAHGESIVVPGSFDGKRLLRWDGDSSIPGGGGHIVIANVDGTQIDVSKEAGVYSSSPHYFWDSEMRDMRAARWSGDSVLFPGIANAGAAAVTLFSRAADGTMTKLATDASPATLGGGAINAAPTGAFLYATADGSLAIAEKAGPRVLVKAPQGQIALFRAVSPDGSKVLVSLASATSSGGRADFSVVDVATGKATTLTASKTDALRIYGEIDGVWAQKECGYDWLESASVANDGSTFFLVGFGSSLTTCARDYLPPEMWRVAADGTLADTSRVVLGDLALPRDSRGWVDGPRPRALDTDRVLLTQCGFEGWSCAARVMNTPSLASAPGPTKPTTTTGDDDDDSPVVVGGVDDDDDAPAPSKKDATTPTTSEPPPVSTPSPAAPTAASSCSAAPGMHGSFGPFAVVAIVFGAALRRRKRAALLVAGLGLAGCSGGKDASTATSNVETTSTDPFAKSIVDIATLRKAPSGDSFSTFGIRDPRRTAVRHAGEMAPYYGDCVFAGCARMFDLETNKVWDASTLGVFVDSHGSTNDAAWQLSPKRQWVVFRKPSSDPEKPAGAANLIAFSELDHGERAIALPASGFDRWVSDDLLVQIVSTTKARGIDPKTQAVKFEVEVPAPDQKYGLTYPSFVASGDASTIVIAGGNAAKVIKVSDFSVADIAGWDALVAPRVQVLPTRSGFVVSSTSTHASRSVISTLAADGTLKTLADAVLGALTVAPDGRFAYARPATADRPETTTLEDATVVIHDEGKPDVELTTHDMGGLLTFSPDGTWIKAEQFAAYSTFARTDASGAMKRFVPTFDDGRVASDLWITPSYGQTIVRVAMPSPHQDDARLYTVDLATGAKTELLHDASAVPSNGVVIEDGAKDPSLFVRDKANGGTLMTLAGDELGEVTDLEVTLGWSHGWLFYLAKPASESYPWQRQLHAVSRDGKANVAIGAMLDEVVSVIRGDWTTAPSGGTLDELVIRSGTKVFALQPPTYDPTTPAPASPPATTGDDDDSGAIAPAEETKKPRASSSPGSSEETATEEKEETTLPPAPAPSKTENAATTACSAAPGSRRGSAFGVALLFALALLSRRRRALLHCPLRQRRYASIHSNPVGLGVGTGSSVMSIACFSLPRLHTATMRLSSRSAIVATVTRTPSTSVSNGSSSSSSNLVNQPVACSHSS